MVGELSCSPAWDLLLSPPTFSASVSTQLCQGTKLCRSNSSCAAVRFNLTHCLVHLSLPVQNFQWLPSPLDQNRLSSLAFKAHLGPSLPFWSDCLGTVSSEMNHLPPWISLLLDLGLSGLSTLLRTLPLSPLDCVC